MQFTWHVDKILKLRKTTIKSDCQIAFISIFKLLELYFRISLEIIVWWMISNQLLSGKRKYILLQIFRFLASCFSLNFAGRIIWKSRDNNRFYIRVVIEIFFKIEDYSVTLMGKLVSSISVISCDMLDLFFHFFSSNSERSICLVLVDCTI